MDFENKTPGDRHSARFLLKWSQVNFFGDQQSKKLKASYLKKEKFQLNQSRNFWVIQW